MTTTRTFLLKDPTISSDPVGSGCYYNSGNYLVFPYPPCSSYPKKQVGTLVFQNWTLPTSPTTNAGPGMQVLRLDVTNEAFYLATLATQINGVLQPPEAATITGTSALSGLLVTDVLNGSATFVRRPRYGGIKITLVYTIIPKNIAETQSTDFLLTDKVVHPITVSPSSVYRVGSFTIRDIQNNEALGTQYFQGYGDSGSNTAIGAQSLILTNQVFFTSIFAVYQNITLPNSPLTALAGTVTGGQRFTKYVTSGIEQTLVFSNTLDQTCSLFYQQSLPILPTTASYVLVNKSVQVIVFPGDPAGIVRLGTYDVVDPTTRRVVGTQYFQTYLQDPNHGTGSFATDFGEGNLLFGSYYVMLVDPLDPKSGYTNERSMTGGSGEYAGIARGWVVTTSQTPTEESITFFYTTSI